LNDDTNNVDAAAGNDGDTTAGNVGAVTGDESTEESTGREDGDNEQSVLRTRLRLGSAG
jgi:hypothetical protein